MLRPLISSACPVALFLAVSFGCSSSTSDTMPPGTGGKTGQAGATSAQGGASAGSGQGGANANQQGGSLSSAGGTTNSGTGGTAPSMGGSGNGGNATAGSGTSGSAAGGNSGGSGMGGAQNHGGTTTNGGTGGGGKAAGGVANGGASTGGKSTNGGTANGGSTNGGGPNGGSAGASAAGGSGGGTTTCTPPAPGSKGTNPLFSDQYTADPAPLVYNCTFYIGCGHDEGSTGFVMREWFVLSSKDMVHWTKQVALKLSDFKWASANAWAGQIVGPKNGKFYWYVPVAEASSGGAMAIGVAVADSPTGPWKDAIGKALVNDAFEMQNFGYSQASQTAYTIDPTVYIDDDGQAYLHYGSFGRMVEGKLNGDMISFNGKLQESTPQGFFEAPFLTKRNNVWYEIYAAGANPATIDYATSSSPMGPWTRKGRILDAMPGVAGQDAPTSHSGVAQFAGQWYLVYHVSNGPNGGGTYKREVAVDKLNFNADGTIQKVTPSGGLSF